MLKLIRLIKESRNFKCNPHISVSDNGVISTTAEHYRNSPKAREACRIVSDYFKEKSMPETRLEFNELPDYADVIPIEEFKDLVSAGFLCSYDGHGRFAKEGKESNMYVEISKIKEGYIPEWATHVAWYNR